MLVVHCEDYLATVAEFAESKGEECVKSLWSHLWKLHFYFRDHSQAYEALNWNTLDESVLQEIVYRPGQRAVPEHWKRYSKGVMECHLTSDFSPASFNWVVRHAETGAGQMNGGMIYHGDQSGWKMRDGTVIPKGYRVDTMSVTIEPIQYWSLHT